MCLLEAMSYGLPVVATPVGGIPDLIHSGEDGILITPGDIAGFSSALIQLLENQDGIRGRLGSAARETVRTRCGLTSVAALLSSLYREIGAARNRPGRPNRHSSGLLGENSGSQIAAGDRAR
jgi:glycosyltransferase involved in cell wall biosynthesis